jgi:peptide/nickel transport system permease protein
LTRYVVKRFGLAALVLVGVMTISFVIGRVLPASPVELLLGAKPTAEQVERMTRELGLDRPLHRQYTRFVGELLRGELGRSFRSGRPVLTEVTERAGASIELVTLSLILAVAVGIPLGVLLAVRNGRRFEVALRLLTVTGGALPTFFIGLLLQLVFFGFMGWLPLNGRLGAEIAIDHPFPRATGIYLIDALWHGDAAAFTSVLAHLVLPVVTLAFSSVAVIARVTGNLLIEVLHSDYIRTARAYGLPPRLIHYKLALRPALTSVLTVVGLTYGFLLGNSVFVEFVYDWPGLGEYALRAVLESDYPAVMGVTLVLSGAYLLVNLVIDLINFAVDPRLEPT